MSNEILIEALRRAVMEPGPHRLFRSGKLDGLFPSRGGPQTEAAALALDKGYLEVVRSEVKGKTTIEWVQLAPPGVEFLHAHESPLPVLEELRQILQTNQESLPVWLAHMQQEIRALAVQLAEQAKSWTQRLEILGQRVEEALRRADAGRLPPGDGAAAWALDALGYLDRRQASGAKDACALPELFSALRQSHPELSIQDFHGGLRRLYDQRALKLLPFQGPSDQMPQPEFALLDGPAILYFVTR